jgi:hypothetical protein
MSGQLPPPDGRIPVLNLYQPSMVLPQKPLSEGHMLFGDMATKPFGLTHHDAFSMVIAGEVNGSSWPRSSGVEYEGFGEVDNAAWRWKTHSPGVVPSTLS